MKSPLLAAACIVAFVTLTVCFAQPKQQPHGLTADQLATALGWSWWDMSIPQDYAGQILGLAYKTTDGVERHGGGSGWIPGEQVQVFLGDLNSDRISYAVIGARTKLRGSIDNSVRGQISCPLVPSNRTIKLGQVLIKTSSDGSVRHGPELRAAETGLVLALSSGEE